MKLLMIAAWAVAVKTEPKLVLRLKTRGGATMLVKAVNKATGSAGLAGVLICEAVPEWGLERTTTNFPVDANTIALFRDNLAGMLSVFSFAVTSRDETALLNSVLLSLLAFHMANLRRWYVRNTKHDLWTSGGLGALFLAAKFDKFIGPRLALTVGAVVFGYKALRFGFQPKAYLKTSDFPVDQHTTFLTRRSATSFLGLCVLCLGGLDPYLSYDRLAFRTLFLSLSMLVVLSNISSL